MRIITQRALWAILILLAACSGGNTPTATPEAPEPISLGNRILTIANSEESRIELPAGDYQFNGFLVWGESPTVQMGFSTGTVDNFPFKERGNEKPFNGVAYLSINPNYMHPAVAVVFLLTMQEADGDWPDGMAMFLADEAIDAIYKFGGQGTIDPCGQKYGVVDQFTDKWGQKMGEQFATEWVAKAGCTYLPRVLANKMYPQLVATGIIELGIGKLNASTIGFSIIGPTGGPFETFAVPIGNVAPPTSTFTIGAESPMDIAPYGVFSGALARGDFRGPGAETELRFYQDQAESQSIYLYFVGISQPQSDPEIYEITNWLQQANLDWPRVCPIMAAAIPKTSFADQQDTGTLGIFKLGPRWWAVLNALRQLKCQ